MKKSILSLFAVVLCFNIAMADVVWETGSYTPSEWAPSSDNLLTLEGVTVTDGLTAYTETGKNMIGIEGLFDAVVPNSLDDYTKVVGIKSGTATWGFSGSAKFDVYQVKVFTRWGDGGVTVSPSGMLRFRPITRTGQLFPPGLHTELVIIAAQALCSPDCMMTVIRRLPRIFLISG